MKNSKVIWIILGTVIAAFAAYGAYILFKKYNAKKAKTKSEDMENECDELFTDDDIEEIKNLGSTSNFRNNDKQ